MPPPKRARWGSSSRGPSEIKGGLAAALIVELASYGNGGASPSPQGGEEAALRVARAGGVFGGQPLGDHAADNAAKEGRDPEQPQRLQRRRSSEQRGGG